MQLLLLVSERIRVLDVAVFSAADAAAAAAAAASVADKLGCVWCKIEECELGDDALAVEFVFSKV